MALACNVVLLLLFVCCYTCLEACNTQSDCALPGLRCVYKVGKGFWVACEIKPNGVNKLCKCRKGCLTCSGGRHIGISRFIKTNTAVKMGCGVNQCGCSHAASNSIFCNLAACVGQDWVGHCTSGGGIFPFSNFIRSP